jgi:hypothetical protein
MKKLVLSIVLVVLGLDSANAQFDLGSLAGKLKEAAGNLVDKVEEETGSSEIAAGLESLIGAFLPETEIPGTWEYLDVAVEFESSDALTQAGGVLAAETVEDKIAPMLTKLGIKPGAFRFTFNEDGTATTTVGKKTISGTWKYDKEKEIVTLGLKNKEFQMRMTVNGENINILFEANKLLELVKTISAKSSNATITAIGAVVKAYDGMNIGFECKKVK